MIKVKVVLFICSYVLFLTAVAVRRQIDGEPRSPKMADVVSELPELELDVPETVIARPIYEEVLAAYERV